MKWLMILLYSVTLVATQLDHPIANKPCSENKDCWDQALLDETAEDNLHPIPQLTCINSTCQCDSSTSILAPVRVSYTATHAGNPDFVGYSFLYPGNRTLCAPKMGQYCAGRGYCAPGSYCVYHSIFSEKGTCRCNPGTRYSNATGLCECRGGQVLNDDGRCSGPSVDNACTDHDGCGIDTISGADLICSAGRCQCNDTVSVFESVKTSDTKVHADYPDFRGYHTEVPESGNMCAPKAEQRCSGRGYCAPGAYCVYHSRGTWSGICKCIPGTVLNPSTGNCECKRGQTLNADGVCNGANMNSTCQHDDDCGIDADSNLELVCVEGTCQCNSSVSVYATVGTSHISVHVGDPTYQGYLTFINNQTLCSPKPERPCAGRGYCSPKSYCVYRSPRSWVGTCKCIPQAEVSKTTGLCECKPGFVYDEYEQYCKPSGNRTEVNDSINEVGISPAAEAATLPSSEAKVGQTLGFVILGIALIVALVAGGFFVVKKYFYHNGVLMPLSFPLRRSGTQLI